MPPPPEALAETETSVPSGTDSPIDRPALRWRPKSTKTVPKAAAFRGSGREIDAARMREEDPSASTRLMRLRST